MTNLFAEMNKEVAEHFQDKQQEQPKDEWAGFKSYNVGGQRVIDLTSCDFEYKPTKFNHQDIERQQIYGDKAGSTKF